MKSIRFIKESFLNFPENIANLITGITDFVVEKFDIAKNFITKTIPQFFTDMKNSIISLNTNLVLSSKFSYLIISFGTSRFFQER